MGKHPGTSRGADYMRGFTWGVQGEEVVMANLNKQLEGIKTRTMGGLISAAAHIREQTEHGAAPITPVDYGNLRASWFVTIASRIVNGSSPSFVGPDAGQMTANHASVLNETQGIVASQSTPSKKFLMMGYSVNYSGFVHEMVGANFNPVNRQGKALRREGAGPKWLETHIKKNTSKIVQIVKENAQIKG